MYIRTKSIPTIIILSLITCGIYYYVWIYQTSEEINNSLGDQEGGGLEVLFCLITCGIYTVYWHYKYSQKLLRLSGNMNVTISDNTTLYVILMIANYFTGGVATFVSQGIFQSQINQMTTTRPGTPYVEAPYQPAPEPQSAPEPQDSQPEPPQE